MSNTENKCNLKTYWVYFDSGNDIITMRVKAKNIKEAKKKAQEIKKKHFQNDRIIKTTVRFRQ